MKETKNTFHSNWCFVVTHKVEGGSVYQTVVEVKDQIKFLKNIMTINVQSKQHFQARIRSGPSSEAF